MATVPAPARLQRFAADRRGSVSVYAALALTLGLGGGPWPSISAGWNCCAPSCRPAPMPGASAAATALDGRAGARQRAAQLATGWC